MERSPKFIYEVNAIPIKIQADFFFWVEIDGLIRKFIWKYKELGKAKAASSAFSAGWMASPAIPTWTVLRTRLQA